MLESQICIFWADWEITRQGAIRLSRVGSSRLLNKWTKDKIFCSIRYIEKIIVSEISRFLKVPYDCGNRLSTASSLRFDLASLTIAILIATWHTSRVNNSNRFFLDSLGCVSPSSLPSWLVNRKRTEQKLKLRKLVDLKFCVFTDILTFSEQLVFFLPD